MLSRLTINSRSLFRKKIKRVFELGQQKVQLNDIQTDQQKRNPNRFRIGLTEIRNIQQDLKNSHESQYFKQELQNWRDMSFNQLCNLSTFSHHKIHYDLKKFSFNVDQQDLQKIFEQQQCLPVYSQAFSMSPFYQNAYQLLTNKKSLQSEFLKKQRNLATMFFDLQPVQDPKLKKTIQSFVKNLTKPIQIQNYTQATFVRFLLGLKRDLMIRGVQLNQIDPNSQIKLIKVVNYEHEFWYDVYHNRSKNADAQNFIIFEKQIENPNESLLVRENYPTLKIKYIARKRKNKDYQACVCTKIQILLQIDGKQHTVKVQWKSGSQGFGKFKRRNIQGQEIKQINYIIIDFDNLFKGNPTIRSVFDL